MKKIMFIALSILSLAMPVSAADGLMSVSSAFSVEETSDRVESILKEKGMTLFNRIKHSESADKIGIKLRDTELIIFGNPKVGSLLMKCQQSTAIDLPQKILIWQDNKATVWVSYNAPRFLEKRHDITGCEAVISKIEKALANIVTAASTK